MPEKGRLRKLGDYLNRQRVKLRTTSLGTALGVNPATHTGSRTGGHESTSYLLTKKLTPWSGGPMPAALLAELLGEGNEAAAAFLSGLSGGELVGPSGYDPEDVQANRRGIVLALQEMGLRLPGMPPLSPTEHP